MTLKQFTHSAYLTVFPQGATVTPRAHGLDLSKYDLKFTPETATGQLDFVIQRASYRTTRDEAFTTLVDSVMRVPIRGAYHYLASGTSWLSQADKFIEIVKGYDFHFYVCDFEGAYNTLTTDFSYQAWQWIHYVQEKTGKPVLLYTSPSLYSKYIYPSQAKFRIDWNTVGLWTAQWFYTPNPNGTPSNPTGRTAGWLLWQYTDKGDGPLYGVARPGACDLDVFNGTVQEMRDYFRIWEPVPEEEDELAIENAIKEVEDAIRDMATLLVAKFGDMENRYDAKMDKLIVAVEGIQIVDGDDGGGTTPPPATIYTIHRVVERDANMNSKVVVYKTPSDNDTSKDTIWVGGKPQEIKVITRWQDVPAGLVGWKDLDEMHKLNTYDEWACACSPFMFNANGVRIAFPDIFVAGGTGTPVRATYYWIHRKDLGAKVG